MENAKRIYMEIKDGIQDIQRQVQFLGTVMTSDIALGDIERAGALIIFDGLSDQLSELSNKATTAFAVIDQGSAPS